MAWGDPGVSKRMLLSGGPVAWGVGGQPATANIPQTGILRRLRLLHNTGAPTFTPGTGTIALDVQAPGNWYSRFILAPNAQAPIFNASGFGTSLIRAMRSKEQKPNTPDTAIVTEVGGQTATSVYNGSATTGVLPLNFYYDLPVAQMVRSLGGEIGLFPLQNPAVQLALQYTPNSGSVASPYNMASTTPTAEPYLITGNATVTVPTPTLEVVRDLWEVPANQADYPVFDFVSSWTEETPQGASVVGATQVTWQATPLSGILVRVGGYILDGSTNKGIASGSLSAGNAIALLYGSGTAKFSETSFDALTRQREEYGFDLPLGFYGYDLMGPDLTLADALDTFSVANIQLQFNIATALAAGSAVKIVRQTLMPLVVQ